MSKIDLQYDLANYTPASASPVEANFNRIEQHINQEIIERGGTVAMTAQLRLVGDPVEALDAAPKQYVDQVLPIGIVMMYGGTVVPPGGRWAICNGAELQSANYPALFAVIGTNFSPAGTPSGRFNLPNMLDRMPVGYGGVAAAVGGTGGSKDIVTVAHSHTHNHAHDMTHAHAGSSTGTVSADHVHSFGTSIENAQHNHYLNMGEFFRYSGDPVDNVNTFAVRVGDGITIGMTKVNTYTTPTGYENQNHAHSGSTGGISANHTHVTNTPTFAANTGTGGGETSSTGVSPANTNYPPFIGMAYIMRVI